MAEEIVDLAGSRVEDPRYVDNVIFDKEGLNELLTHIKNYPIIDIDYVEEHDKDALNTDKEVWPIYTEGTPCIKVTYGDSNNANGNLSKQNKQTIHNLQEVYRLLNGVQNIINKYNTIDEEYITLIKNLEEELNKILYNISLKYHNLLNADYENFIIYKTVINEQTGEIETTNEVLAEGLECWNLDQNTPSKIQHDINADPPLDIWGGSLYNAFDESFINSCLYHTASNSQDNRLADGLKYKITYQINSFSNRIEYWIRNPDLIDNENAFYTTTYGTRENKKIINPLPSEGASEFYIIPLMPTISGTFDKTSFKNYVTPQGTDTVSALDGFLAQVFPDISTDPIEIKQKKAQLKDSFNHYNDLLLNLEDILNTGGANNEGNIKTLLHKYIGYLQESRWKRYEEIRKYLVSNNINTVQLQNGTEINLKTITVSQYSTSSSSNYYKVSQYVKENYIGQDKQNILNQIQDIIDGCVENKYTAVPSNATYNSTKEYYIFNEDTKHYERVDIQSFENGITYYTLNANNYPATYGYKYVKVGSNITWDSNYDTVIQDGTANQKSGTFRITINGHTFEVPIKGFGTNASDEPITINTTHNNGITIKAKNSNVLKPITLDGNITVTGTTNLQGNVTLGTSSGASNLLPGKDNSGTIGSSSSKWNTIYATNIGASGTRVSNGYFETITTNKITDNDGIIQIGNAGSSNSSGVAQLVPANYTDSSLGTGQVSKNGNTITGITFTNPWDTAFITNSYTDTGTFNNINIKLGNTYTDLSSYINNQVTYDDNHPLEVTNTTDGIQGSSNNGASLPSGTIAGNTSASINTAGGIYAAQNIYALRVFNAVFNDYAECRTTIDLTPGHVVIDQDDGSLVCSFKRLQSGAQVISDTYGHLMGATDKATTPIAVAGRVLVYTYQPRENYHAGMAVCSAPNGTVDIMSRAEICEYPDCIVGIVSEIPDYEIWGSDNVKVDGRIWIKVR